MNFFRNLTRNGRIGLTILAIVIGYFAIPRLLQTDFSKSVVNFAAPGSSAAGSESIAAKGDNTINVCVVTWVGYAGGQYFNGGFEASKNSRYYKEYGILVNFKLMDVAWETSMAAWQSDQCQVHWTTADSAPTQFDDLKAAGFNPKIFMQADLSRGGDAIVVTRGINSMNDLRGKRIAVAYGSPSHTFILRALEAANMTVRDVALVQMGTATDAAAAFKAKAVDAAVVWSPDDADAVGSVPGSKVLTSTKDARYIISDVFFAKAEWLDSHKSQAKALVEGWLKGNAELNSSAKAREEVVPILMKGLSQPRNYFDTTLMNARWTTYGDNVAFFNLEGNAPEIVRGERLYNETGQLYRRYSDLVKNAPNWREVTDTSVISSISTLTGAANAAEEGVKFTPPTREMETAKSVSDKPLSITFMSGLATLDDNAKQLIDIGFVPTAQSFAGYRIRIEGNTDSTGSPKANQELSERRAQAVADYLATEWKFDRNRFVTKGNGQDKPACNESSPGARSLSECQAANRRTEFQLLSSR